MRSLTTGISYRGEELRSWRGEPRRRRINSYQIPEEKQFLLPAVRIPSKPGISIFSLILVSSIKSRCQLPFLFLQESKRIFSFIPCGNGAGIFTRDIPALFWAPIFRYTKMEHSCVKRSFLVCFVIPSSNKKSRFSRKKGRNKMQTADFHFH